ncbi:MAG: adenylate/guanylate cyclase domain-containing protein [Treponema sp.]|nr:adenylate/guanylate cyclase domain-containing protein [Treponema sp.]
MLSKKFSALTLAFLGLISSAISQNENIEFSNSSEIINDDFLSEYVARSWTASDGLPGNSITDIMQDASGYIYIGTYDGLVRFDGVEFVKLNRNYDKRFNFVSTRVMHQDTKGNMWIGTNDEGLIFIDKSNKDYSKTFSMENGLPNNSIRALVEDRDGNIWIGTASGICYLDNNYNIVTPSGLEKYGDEKILVNDLYCDTAGRIWLTTLHENGLYVFSDSNNCFSRFEGIKKIKNPIISVVKQDRSGAFWFGTSPHYVIRLDGTSESIFNIGHGVQQGTIIKSIYQDKNNNIWFATDNGLTILNGGNFSYYDKNKGLVDNKITRIIEDREGNIWIGTDCGGIQKLSLSKFKTIPLNTTVNAIANDKFREVVWIASDNGVYCYSGNKFVENKITKECRNVRIRDVSVTENGDLLVSSYDKLGVMKYDLNSNFVSWKKEDGLTGNKARVTFKAKNGDIYIGTTTGLNIVDCKTGKITNITKEDGIANDYIMCITQTPDGRIWCGTDGGGIFILKDRKVDEIYNHEKGLSGNVVFKIITEEETGIKDGVIWVSTGNGISRIHDGKIDNYNSSCGLPADGIFQIIVDYTKTAWFTSNLGVFCAKYSDFEDYAEGKIDLIQVRKFGKSDGLVSGGVTSTSRSMKDEIGRLWFTLIDGFAVYDPIKITANKISPIIDIQSVTIENEKHNPGESTFIIKPEAKRISIKYTGLSFVSSDQMRFSYKLDGFDQDYSEWTTNREVSYTNLKHGTYTFSVMTKNGDDIVSETSRELIFIKKPFIWELAWFWIVVILLVSGITGLIIYARFRSMKKYQAELEAKVDERTRELRLEKEKSENLLLNILPEEVARELAEKPNETIAQSFPNATVLFTDIVGFTNLSSGLSASQVVELLNKLVTIFDNRAKTEGIEKIKTIGDAYMAATGLTTVQDNKGVSQMINFARGLLNDVVIFNAQSKIKVQIRIGINCGNLVAGIIGKSKFIYDIWGDTVNVASRMENSGEPMRIHVSQAIYESAKNEFNFTGPVEIDIKGKGKLKTFYLEEKTQCHI